MSETLEEFLTRINAFYDRYKLGFQGTRGEELLTSFTDIMDFLNVFSSLVFKDAFFKSFLEHVRAQQILIQLLESTGQVFEAGDSIFEPGAYTAFRDRVIPDSRQVVIGSETTALYKEFMLEVRKIAITLFNMTSVLQVTGDSPAVFKPSKIGDKLHGYMFTDKITKLLLPVRIAKKRFPDIKYLGFPCYSVREERIHFGSTRSFLEPLLMSPSPEDDNRLFEFFYFAFGVIKGKNVLKYYKPNKNLIRLAISAGQAMQAVSTPSTPGRTPSTTPRATRSRAASMEPGFEFRGGEQAMVDNFLRYLAGRPPTPRATTPRTPSPTMEELDERLRRLQGDTGYPSENVLRPQTFSEFDFNLPDFTGQEVTRKKTKTKTTQVSDQGIIFFIFFLFSLCNFFT
jgi:hypothetical protein